MIPTLNPVTTGRDAAPEEFLDAASNAGFPAVDYTILPFYRAYREQSFAAAREMLEKRGLILGSFGLPVEFRKDEALFRKELAALPDIARFAAELGATRCCTWLYPATDESVAEYTSRFIRRLRECAKVLEASGIRFGIEWVGPKTLRTLKHDFIHTLPGVLEMIDAIDVPGVGVLFDSFHWFTSGATRQDILALKPEQIVLVHLNDAPDKPADEQIDGQRLLPGEGIIDLHGMLSALKEIGYDSFVSVETFSDSLPLLGSREAAVRTKKALDRVLEGYL
ncbi:sugar phosphate isomerase/epimerase family protein [Cohnella zeiphila]|uniref:Sugar phosphate isomerase/epimerase n=1 Tax=Cohnella zeiphila TaxID=2761120 RepID=A0A7X0SIP1_9BACL|nr:sugar phosphate isomerase/epimerase family protein [Cohnella zeiphila]MBB6730682.1 sugar phosphate isomerase/epimerase [Cohnella zeiphila]